MTHIATDMEFEITYWARRFGMTKAELRGVIAQVGNLIVAVRGRVDAVSEKLAA